MVMELELEEPWEALDLDDSDLPSLLRPCKRRRSLSPSSSTHPSPPPPTQPPLQSHPQLHLDHPPPPSSSRRRSIPGPAGAVHAAILRRDLDRENRNFSHLDKGDDGLLSTQHYIRKAMDDTAEFDVDFSHHPWISALQFLGAEDGLIPSTPISSIKKCSNGERIVQVVAVVKSCTPNGLGGLLVSLKDPTGTIGASIHHKVLSQGDFGKEITTGAVLILKEVAIFAPVRSARYLNVTMRNLVKVLISQQNENLWGIGVKVFEIQETSNDVFSQNKGSTTELYESVHPVQYADPESCRKAREVEDVQIVIREDTEMRHCTRTENTQNDNITQRQNLFAGSSQLNNRDSSNITAAKRGYVNLSQHACNEGPKEIIRTRITGDGQEVVNGTQGAKGGSVAGSPSRRPLLEDTDDATNPRAESTCEKARGTNEVPMQRQPVMSTTTLPEWTDEQLNELFAGDEDGVSLI